LEEALQRPDREGKAVAEVSLGGFCAAPLLTGLLARLKEEVGACACLDLFVEELMLRGTMLLCWFLPFARKKLRASIWRQSLTILMDQAPDTAERRNT